MTVWGGAELCGPGRVGGAREDDGQAESRGLGVALLTAGAVGDPRRRRLAPIQRLGWDAVAAAQPRLRLCNTQGGRAAPGNRALLAGARGHHPPLFEKQSLKKKKKEGEGGGEGLELYRLHCCLFPGMDSLYKIIHEPKVEKGRRACYSSFSVLFKGDELYRFDCCLHGRGAGEAGYLCFNAMGCEVVQGRQRGGSAGVKRALNEPRGT